MQELCVRVCGFILFHKFNRFAIYAWSSVLNNQLMEIWWWKQVSFCPRMFLCRFSELNGSNKCFGDCIPTWGYSKVWVGNARNLTDKSEKLLSKLSNAVTVLAEQLKGWHFCFARKMSMNIGTTFCAFLCVKCYFVFFNVNMLVLVPVFSFFCDNLFVSLLNV